MNLWGTLLKIVKRDLPGGPIVKTSPSNIGDAGSTPDPEAKVPHASQSKNQKIKQVTLLLLVNFSVMSDSL